MAEPEESTAHVQVAGAKERDMGKGTARLDRQVLLQLGLREGEVIEISGGAARRRSPCGRTPRTRG